jgi:uncharacterized membrane protein YvlD (DUF360 family)
MHALRTLLRALFSFVVIWVAGAVALWLTSQLVPGITLTAVDERPVWTTAVAAAFILGLSNLIIRPLFLLLAMPLGFIALFIAGFFVNAVVLRLTANVLSPAFTVTNWFSAVLGSIVLSLIIGLVTTLLNFDDENFFYESVLQRRLSRRPVELPANPTRGIVMLEIDGLSYHHLHYAIDQGYMPHLKELIERHDYVLTRTESGVPSMTSSAQAGILFGDNHDIPAFRWFDKAENKLYVSSKDAAAINARFAKGEGLLRDGASVNNLFNGDAAVSLLTAADLRSGTAEQQRARARDVYTLLLNPNFFLRVIGLVVGEALLEVWQYTRDVAAGVQPRLNRLHNFYPLVRAATTVFMREVSGFLTLMQIVRGEPAIYTTWPGYDEVAHHSGPWSKYALATLRGYDRFIGAVLEAIATRAPRPYELFVLSDHGQSFGATFLQRYGYTLKDFIQEQMPAGSVVTHTSGGDDGLVSVMAVAAELGNVQAAGVGGRLGQRAAQEMQRAAEGMTDSYGTAATLETTTDVTFCGSGNLAQVYFHAFPGRATLSDLNTAYPGLVDAVVQHEGVGLLIAADDDGAALVFAKGGARNLRTGETSGEDPLLPYGDVALRVWQLQRLSDFPSTGDLIVMGALYADGTVAALEELIGNHGGLGGEQTDSFLLHPADLHVPPTRCTTDIFPLLNGRRGLAAPRLAPPAEDPRGDWTLSTLWDGLRRVGVWLPLALRALVLDRAAYRAIAAGADLTGPALLISLVGVFINTLVNAGANPALTFAFRYGLWWLAALVIHGAAHVVRGKGTFMNTFRVLGFAQMVSLLQLLRLVPGLDSAAAFTTALLSLFVVWLGLSEAHQVRGWRTVLMPVLYLTLFVVGAALAITLLSGLSVAVETLLSAFGLRP